MTMIPHWYYLVGLIPLLMLIIPRRRSIRLVIVVVSVLVLFYIWNGVSRAQTIEKEIGQQKIQELTKVLQVERDGSEAKVLKMTVQNKELSAELADANSVMTRLKEEHAVLQDALQTALDTLSRIQKGLRQEQAQISSIAMVTRTLVVINRKANQVSFSYACSPSCFVLATVPNAVCITPC